MTPLPSAWTKSWHACRRSNPISDLRLKARQLRRAFLFLGIIYMTPFLTHSAATRMEAI